MPTPDPRKLSVFRTANEEIQDRAIRHAVFMESFKNRTQNRILSFLNDEVFPSLFGTIFGRLDRIATRGYDTGLATTQRLADMAAAIDNIIGTGVRDGFRLLREDLRSLTVTEARFQQAVVTQAVPISIEFVVPSVRTLNSVVTSRPFQGKVLREWSRELDQSSKRLIRQHLTQGLALGETTEQIVRRIRGTSALGFGDGAAATIRRNISSIARTAITHVSNHSREALYAENRDMIVGVRYLATLDARTTDICASLDGRIFRVGEGERPPMHIRCRSTTTPVLKSWRQLGLKGLPDATRASMSGQVPETLTYPRWLRQQPREFVEMALGRGRAKLFLDRRINIDRFVDRGRSLSLEQILDREGINLN